MPKGKKTDKEKLSLGAAEIAAAEKQLKEETVVIPKSTRSLDEIVRDRVEIQPGNIGLKIDDKTPIEESLRILDWTMALSDHVGFMIGDVLNFGNTKWGTKYTAALNQTNRALSTLKGYAEASRRIPLEKRVASLTFSHHREMLRLPDEKLDGVLKEVGGQAEKGKAPTTKELRFKVQKLTPRRKPKKVTSGKGKKGKTKPELPPYEPTAEEQSKLDEAEEALERSVDAVKSAKLYAIVAKLDTKEKKRWLGLVEPLVTFYNAVDKVTGY